MAQLSNEKLCAAIQDGRKDAESELLKQNESLVYSIANQYKYLCNERFEFEDALQVGRLGLLRAAHKYQLGSEAKFSTYATYWIKQMIQREGEKNEYAFSGMQYGKQKLTSGTVDDCSQAYLEKISVASLDELVSSEDDKGKTYLDYCASDEDSTRERCSTEAVFDAAMEVIDTFNETMRQVIQMSFGVTQSGSFTPWKLEEIAETLGISTEAARQNKLRAIEILKRRLVKKN